FGYFTLLAAKKVGKKGKVIAFEPEPKNYGYLKKKIERYNLKNVVLIKKALFNKETKLNLRRRFMFSSVIEYRKDPIKEACVLATTLDKELKRLKIRKVDFIKMDIEGTEIEAIEGAKETLKSKPHLAIACYHKREGKTTGKILTSVLNESGFNTEIGFFLHPTIYNIK
ncbi:unnamed protein product, partial [marine sediment metagenome]